MMKGSESLGYDRGLTMFSPEGRLFQVEYALEAVKRGTLAVAIKAKDGAVLAVHRKVTSKLMDISNIHKIYLIDKHIGAAISGLHADARILVDQARIQSAIHRLTYDEDISVFILVKKLCDLKQAYSQHGGVRPFGASLMFVGVDTDGPQIFTTSPSGAYFSWKAIAIGYRSDEAQEYLKDNYKELKSIDEVKHLAIKTLKTFVDDDLTTELIEIGTISREDRVFQMLPDDEKSDLLKAVLDEEEAEEEETGPDKEEDDDTKEK
ncbi:MAG: archaeal proteasome endopeptidase complex subunit alpha [Promethearchaeota archaeon]